MSFETITPYFKNCINSIGIFKNVKKPFDQEIPSTMLDRSYCVIIDRIPGTSRNSVDFQIIASILVKLYRKGFLDEETGREESLKDCEKIIKSLMKISNANTQKAIKNVTLRSIDLKALISNDNIIETELYFDVNLRFDPNL